ncbi:hypothetical protein EKD04_025490 [Chloroflexales bacterium ZM16-3]|nr:hypothetical protein [Chloroflexales bacterium ZM16-3]
MNRLRLAANIVHNDLGIDAIDPVVRTWLRSVLASLICILACVALIPTTLNLLDLAGLLVWISLVLFVQWHALRPHMLSHPAVQRWIARDIRFFHAIRIVATLLIFTGLLPIALLLGLLGLLGYALLSSGIAPAPAPVIDPTAPTAIVQAAPAATLAVRSEALGLMDRGRAPPTTATISSLTAVSTTSWPDTPSIIFPLAALLAISILVGRLPDDHDPPSPYTTLLRAALPRAPPLTS